MKLFAHEEGAEYQRYKVRKGLSIKPLLGVGRRGEFWGTRAFREEEW